jgi:hypothetical protein
LHRHSLHTAVAIALLAGVCASAAPAAAASERRVGIVVTTVVNVSEERARGLASTLGEVLHERLVVDVIAGAETERRLPPGGVSAGCVADTSCRQDLGRRLDAEEILLLVVIGAGERVKIDPTWVHVASGKVTSRPAIELAPGADERAVFREAAPVLLPHLDERDAERETTQVVVVTPGVAPAGSGRRLTAPVLIAAGVSAGALIGGAVFGLSAGRKFDNLEADGCRAMPCPKSGIDDLRRDTIVADVLLGTALVAAGVAVTFYVLGDDEAPAAQPAQPAPSVTVAPGPGVVGLSLGGVF